MSQRNAKTVSRRLLPCYNEQAASISSKIVGELGPPETSYFAGSIQPMNCQPFEMSTALESVYRTHRQGLFSLAVSITGSHQLAEDSVHNAFAKLFRHSLPPGDLVAYVYKSVRNAAIDSTRKNRRDIKLNDSLINGFMPPASQPTEPPDDLMTKERHQLLRQAINSLGTEDQEVITLKSFAGLTFEQVGEVTNNSPKTVATRYRRALKKLELQLKDQLV
jgi:RNA polymerase sigma factor (sigma-70 family)